MLLLHETVVLPGGLLEIELHSDMTYRLTYETLVEYLHKQRRVGARTTPYEFRSVEQLRYDFERDVRAAGGTLG
jgi:hypothetical protein